MDQTSEQRQVEAISLIPEIRAAAKVEERLTRVWDRGGMTRPWIKAIPTPQRHAQLADGIMLLWEEGAKTTVEVKHEIQQLLGQGYTLIELLDSKRAEHLEDSNWWPSLMEILRWCEVDAAFAKMLDIWNHAHQLELSERIKHDVMNAEEKGLDPKMLKVKVDYAHRVLPRTVNRGMVERLEVDQNHHHIRGGGDFRAMPEEALRERMRELAANPKVRRLMALQMSQTDPLTVLERAAEPSSPGMQPGHDIIDVTPDLDIPGET